MPVFGLYVLVAALIGFYVGPMLTDGLQLLCATTPGFIAACWLCGLRGVLVLLAWLLATLTGLDYQRLQLHPGLAGQDVVVTGRVVSLPVTLRGRYSFAFRVADAGADGLPERLRLSVYSADIRPEPGETWRLRVRLKPARGYANPGTMSDGLRHFTAGFTAQGYVRPSLSNRELPATNAVNLQGWRGQLANELLHRSPDRIAAAFIAGVSVGVRQHIERSLRDAFRATGTSHLLAISGLHIGLLAGMTWGLSRVLQRFIQFHDGIAALVTLVVAGSYALLAGFSIPTRRALCMLACVLVASVRGRERDGWRVLSAALAGLILTNPSHSLAPGLWLSFIAVSALVHLARRSNRDPSPAGGLAARLHQLAVVQAALALALLVPGAVFFEQVSWISPLANSVAIPVFSLIVLPAGLAAAAAIAIDLPAADTVLQVAAHSTGILLRWVEWLNAFSFSDSALAARSSSEALLLLAAVGSMTLARPLPGRALAVLCVALALAGRLLASPQPSVHLLDVGQGLSLVMQSADNTIIFDTGPGWDEGSAATYTLIPFLRREGITRADLLILSHWDSDHAGGTRDLLGYLDVDTILAPGPDPERRITITPCRAGQRFRYGDIHLRVLHPRHTEGWSDNDASCVLMLELGRLRVSLPGDIELAAEAALLGRGDMHEVDVVVAPHHGSSTSSSTGLIRTLKPRLVLYATGFANRWGFPSPAVVDRWNQVAECSLATGDVGAVSLVRDDVSGNWRLVTGRASALRPWPLREPVSHRCSDVLSRL